MPENRENQTRRDGDTPVKGPVWKLDKAEMYAEKYRPNADELELG